MLRDRAVASNKVTLGGIRKWLCDVHHKQVDGGINAQGGPDLSPENRQME